MHGYYAFTVFAIFQSLNCARYPKSHYLITETNLKLQCCGVESWRDWQEYNPYYAGNDWKPERTRSNDDEDDDNNDRNGKSGKGRGKSRNSKDNDDAAERDLQGQMVKFDLVSVS